MDKWEIKKDKSVNAFIVYRGGEDICGGYFNPSQKTIHNVEFMNPEYQKNNKTRQKAISVISNCFMGYK
jgi:hypothetical protein